MPQIRLLPGGQQFEATADESVLDAALRQGLWLAHGCRQGDCGSCRARLVRGQARIGEAMIEAGGELLLCQARAEGDLEIETAALAGLPGLAIQTLPARVTRLVLRASDVMEIGLRLPAAPRFVFLAGQHIEVLLAPGVARAYSLANPPEVADELTLYVRRVPGGRFSEQVFTRLQVKDLLRVRGPLGSFFLREGEDPVLLLCGGTGIAPVASLVESARRRGVRRPLHLYWGAREQSDLFLEDQIEAWRQVLPDFRYTPVLDRAGQGQVPAAVLRDYPDLSGKDIYASGPPGLIHALRDAFAGHGLATSRFFFDSFEHAR